MPVSDTTCLRNPPEVVVSFVRRLIEVNGTTKARDRRSRQRDEIELPISVQPLDDNFQRAGDAFAAVTKDISTGGIGLSHSEPIATRYLQIEFTNKIGDDITLAAQVRHCTPCGSNFHIGVRFVVDWSKWHGNAGSRSSQE